MKRSSGILIPLSHFLKHEWGEKEERKSMCLLSSYFWKLLCYLWIWHLFVSMLQLGHPLLISHWTPPTCYSSIHPWWLFWLSLHYIKQILWSQCYQVRSIFMPICSRELSPCQPSTIFIYSSSGPCPCYLWLVYLIYSHYLPMYVSCQLLGIH